MRDGRVFHSATLEKERNMSSKLSDVKVLIKHYFGEFCRQKKEEEFCLLITGKTGVGKSSLVNALLGRKLAKEGHKKVAGTPEVTSYRVTIEGGNIRVWDSPGLGDGTGNDEEYLAEIESEIKEKLDLVIFCVKMDDRRLNVGDRDTLKRLTETFGKNRWKNAVIAHWREAIQKFLSKDLKLDSALVQSLPLVPTGYHRKPSVLLNGTKWPAKFFIHSFQLVPNQHCSSKIPWD